MLTGRRDRRVAGPARGYHLATRSPSTVRGLIVQNGNAHNEWLGSACGTSAATTGADLTEETRAASNRGCTTKARNHVPPGAAGAAGGVRAPGVLGTRLAPNLPGHGLEAHWELFTDYRTHGALRRDRALHRTGQPPTLIVWGVHDPYYDLDGVIAYHRELPAARATSSAPGTSSSKSSPRIPHPFIGRMAERNSS